jgi:hypothetical protein
MVVCALCHRHVMFAERTTTILDGIEPLVAARSNHEQEKRQAARRTVLTS